LDKDAFMKLMLAQMKNQDPTNPMKNEELAAQLAQFASVEQMTNMNQTLAEMQKAQKPQEGFMALNFIGKAVAGDSAKLMRGKGDKEHDLTFNLPDDAKNVSIKIRNEQGEIVRKVDLKDLKKGDNRWTWNGKTENGQTAPTGDYQFFIEGEATNGKKIAVKTDFEGLITGVNYTAEGPVLLVGNQSVKLKDVKKIVDPSLAKTQNVKNATGPDLQKQRPAAENKEEKGAEEAPIVPYSNLEKTVGMSNDMLQRVANETSPQQPGQQPKAQVKPESKGMKL